MEKNWFLLITRCVLFSLAMAASFGCVSRTSRYMMTGKELMERLKPMAQKKPEKRGVDAAERRLTVSVNQMAIREFAGWISEYYNVGVVFSSSLDGLLVSLDLRSATCAEVMQVFSRRYGASCALIGNTYYIGSSRNSDRYIIVRRIAGVPLDDVKSFLTLFSSESVKTSVTASGVIFISVDSDSLTKSLQAISDFEALRPKNYLVRFYVLKRRSDVDVSAGLSYAPLGQVRALFDGVSGGGSLGGLLDPSLALSAVVGEYAYSWVGHGFEGVQYRYNSGREYRVARHQVSEYGYSVSAGSDLIESGLSLQYVVRDYGAGLLCFDFVFSDSSPSGALVDGYPQLDTFRASGNALVPLSRPFLLGVYDDYRSHGGLLSAFVGGLSRSNCQYLIFVCITPSVG